MRVGFGKLDATTGTCVNNVVIGRDVEFFCSQEVLELHNKQSKPVTATAPVAGI